MDLICVGCERAERPKIILAKIFTMIFYHIAMQFAPAGRETNIFAKFANSSSSFIFSFRASDIVFQLQPNRTEVEERVGNH